MHRHTFRARPVRVALFGLALALGCARTLAPGAPEEHDWPITGSGPENSRYSPLTQIDRGNAGTLAVAWTYHTGDGGDKPAQIQATPIVVHGTLYSTSGAGRAFALHAETGVELWHFDPPGGSGGGANRGVVYWESGTERRIFFTAASKLYALDAATGAPVTSFGASGSIDLSKGLGRDTLHEYVTASSPGVIYGDLLIQGSRVGEDDGSSPGYVRAFDTRTGALRWVFHTIPKPGEYGYETWPPDAWRTVGGANSWGGMAVDAARGIVYVPTGSATPDFFGGNRVGANLFANSLLALDAATGKRIWHFQTVHHDVIDMDLPAAPNLVTVTHDGRQVDAVAQITKTGFVFLFDRVTGAPLFPIEERAVPASDIPGEHSWPTQPFPSLPKPFARQGLTAADLTTLSPESNAAMLARLRTLRSEGLFTPPSLAGSVIMPGFDGGGEWGGSAVDRETGVLYVNANDAPAIAALAPVVPKQPVATADAGATPLTGAAVYQRSCAACHGLNRLGDGNRVASLVNIGAKLSATQVRAIIDHGRGFMPAQGTLPLAERDAVTAYVLGLASSASVARTPEPTPEPASSTRSPFRFLGYEVWKDPKGYPAVKPPWGTLNAIDLNTGAFLWKIPLGEYAELKAAGMPITGSGQYGGPIVTAGGVVFIAATQDEKFRAFDKRTGALLFETTLPAAGYAAPSTYMVHGRQYVVIAAGGGKLGTKSSDTYVAFALPR